ncbi:Hypothetical predicted protein [Olea europaea subsp. europaea]|uniref:Uncharacterized protein n=1 Tax=Olea europaea subsp. europaea TaxID=158383 RepID=A0A8S0Q782_OLEEU|nr:Hypothetical predicted protein [Olea europaea subsp. europaea]
MDAAAAANAINTPARIAAWLGQIHAETAGLTRFEENLNYSADGLRATWPKRFPTDAAVQALAHNPQRIAEAVYGGRMGNDNAGDGWLYRGRGMLQLTGKDQYAEAAHWTGLDLVATPALAADPKSAAVIAGAFWRVHGCNALADRGDTTAVTKAINGGVEGLAERQRQTTRAALIWR